MPLPLLSACARRELAPLALDAFPEAYTEFKQAMHLLIQSKERQDVDSSSSIIAAERKDLASLVYHAAFESLGEILAE